MWLLPIVGKIFKRVIYNEMYHFFIQNHPIFPYQSVSNKVTPVYKWTSITPDFYQSLDQGYEVRGISLGISKVFEKSQA